MGAVGGEGVAPGAAGESGMASGETGASGTAGAPATVSTRSAIVALPDSSSARTRTVRGPPLEYA